MNAYLSSSLSLNLLSLETPIVDATGDSGSESLSSDSEFTIASDNACLLPFRFGDGRTAGECDGFTLTGAPSPPTTSAFAHICCDKICVSIPRTAYLVHGKHVDFIDIEKRSKFIIAKNIIPFCRIL
jgi:hypothetical protein